MSFPITPAKDKDMGRDRDTTGLNQAMARFEKLSPGARKAFLEVLIQSDHCQTGREFLDFAVPRLERLGYDVSGLR